MKSISRAIDFTALADTVLDENIDIQIRCAAAKAMALGPRGASDNKAIAYAHIENPATPLALREAFVAGMRNGRYQDQSCLLRAAEKLSRMPLAISPKVGHPSIDDFKVVIRNIDTNNDSISRAVVHMADKFIKYFRSSKDHSLKPLIAETLRRLPADGCRHTNSLKTRILADVNKKDDVNIAVVDMLHRHVLTRSENHNLSRNIGEDLKKFSIPSKLPATKTIGPATKQEPNLVNHKTKETSLKL